MGYIYHVVLRTTCNNENEHVVTADLCWYFQISQNSHHLSVTPMVYLDGVPRLAVAYLARGKEVRQHSEQTCVWRRMKMSSNGLTRLKDIAGV